MTKYGFVIDQRKCIGCHACTVACKSENQVPLGSFRTWVKYIEKGDFPNTRRYFSIERCQHCEDAPCVEICPTVALYKRADGIVDFDGDRCIGCKSCMQACPYDALYIDPRTQTAAKCHYCAHRTDRGLLPACVIVCPTKAIIAGDLQDPASEIAQTAAREQVQVRRPDQGTRPQVFYVGADETALTPGLAMQPSQYMWAELGPKDVDLEPKGSLFELAKPQGSGAGGQGTAGATFGQQAADQAGWPGSLSSDWAAADLAPQGTAAGRAVTVYDVAHPKPWGRKVTSYLWTKAIGAGALGVAGPLLALGFASPVLTLGAGVLAALFTGLTAVLLVWDLKRPERFWRVMAAPNPRSWLVRGAYVLTAYGALAGVWLVAALLGADGLLQVLVWPAVLLAAAAAGYTAFLFGQAEGRDFWQSPLLLWHLLAAAAGAGGGSLLLLVLALDPANTLLASLLSVVLLAGLAAALALVLAELYTPHANKDVATAARLITRGPLARRFWLGYVLVGAVLPALVLLLVLSIGLPLALAAPAAAVALAGLWLYEDIWIRAGQSVAMS